ncbi:transposable element Tcb1 transposase [Trichonephila clavipes]|nr:transposable element Tcb1 transposase [Trichonephila clavipes]
MVERTMDMAMECNDIVFTDESRFCLQHQDGQNGVWTHRGERLLNCCVVHCDTGPAPGIMVSGGIGFHYRTLLVCIFSTLINQH